jgi:hypothetical protein
MINNLKIFIKNFPGEGYIWFTSIILLSIPFAELTSFSLCPFHNLGFEFCPGCGLGRSIHYLIHFQFEKSFTIHPLGGAALLILLFRIFTLIKFSLHQLKNKGALC